MTYSFLHRHLRSASRPVTLYVSLLACPHSSLLAGNYREFPARRGIGFCSICLRDFIYLSHSIGDCHGIANPDDSDCEERLPLQHGAESERQILRADSGPLPAPRLEPRRVFSSQLVRSSHEEAGRRIGLPAAQRREALVLG